MFKKCNVKAKHFTKAMFVIEIWKSNTIIPAIAKKVKCVISAPILCDDLTIPFCAKDWFQLFVIKIYSINAKWSKFILLTTKVLNYKPPVGFICCNISN